MKLFQYILLLLVTNLAFPVNIDDVLFHEQVPFTNGQKITTQEQGIVFSCLIVIRNLDTTKNITSAKVENHKSGRIYIHLNSQAQGSSPIKNSSIKKTLYSLEFQNQTHKVLININPLYLHGIPHKDARKHKDYEIRVETQYLGTIFQKSTKKKTCKGKVSEHNIH